MTEREQERERYARQRLTARGYLTDDGKLTDAGNAYVAAIKAELRRSGGKARERVGE